MVAVPRSVFEPSTTQIKNEITLQVPYPSQPICFSL
jgi:hypothetical protein